MDVEVVFLLQSFDWILSFFSLQLLGWMVSKIMEVENVFLFQSLIWIESYHFYFSYCQVGFLKNSRR